MHAFMFSSDPTHGECATYGSRRSRFVAVLLLFVLGGPSSSSAIEANGPWGVYPDCVAPAVPLEVQAWWLQEGEDLPRHLHQGVCIPNARTADCSDPGNPVVTRPTTFTSRIIAYNNPDEVNFVRWSWQSDVEERVRTDWACEPGSGSAIGTLGLEQCVWFADMTLDPDSGNGGLDELRLTPNISDNEFGKRHFGTLNPQVCTGTGRSQYRKSPDPIARGWYEDYGYSNVKVNYMDFFRGLDETIPTVSGVVEVEIDHQKGSGETRSRLWQDLNHHMFPDVFADPPPVGVPHASGGKLLYDRAGLFDGVYRWDTTELPDGVHVLFPQTLSTDSEGVSIAGLKLIFNVQNGNGPGPSPVPGPGDDETEPEPIFSCSDGIDNDGDGLVDFPADTGCEDFTDDSERTENNECR